MKRTNKGITLIALVITIIVMLILVAVTINMAVNGGLFGFAGKATGDTQKAIESDKSLASGTIKIGDVYYTIGEYLEQVTKNNNSRIKLSYTVTPAEDGLSAVITVNAKMLGGLLKDYKEYREWALEKIEGKEPEEIEQIFVEGQNYWNELENWGEPTYNNIDELVTYWIENWPDDYPECEDIYDIMNLEEYPTLADMAIDYRSVYPEQYEYWDDYLVWAKRQLEGKTDEEIEQIFVEGQNYWNEENDNEEPIYSDIDELVAYWIENWPDDYPECENIYDIANAEGYETLADMAIDYRNVYPEKWDEQEGISNDNIINIIDPSGETWWETNTVEYIIYGDGKYTFIATNETGTESNNVTVEIEGIGEQFSKIYGETKIYTDKNKDTAVIPKGFSVGISEGIDTIETGLVIRDKNGNEFVWIPVTEDLGSSYSSGTNYSEPKELTDVYSAAAYDSQATLDELYGASYYTYSEDFKYAEEYAQMVEKVNQYNGFYIGRYETTIDSDGNIGTKYNTPVLTAGTTLFTKDSTNYPYRWYGLYQAGKNADVSGNGTDVQTAMIYGVLYDQAMQFIRDQKAAGNTTYDVDTATSSWHTGSFVVNSAQANSGKNGDVALNIWDLESNACEWTQEALSTSDRIFRGGFFALYSQFSPASGRSEGGDPTATYTYYSSRVALYIK